jgi:hypothetical protein
MKMIENDRLYDKMDELLFWTRFSALPTFRAMIMDNLRTDIDKLVYELSDGKKSTRDISKIISKGGRKVTHVTVANMWQRWSILNLVIPAQRVGRYKKVLSLESLGIEIPSTEISEEGTS